MNSKNLKNSGIYVRGLCISSSAVVRNRKKDAGSFVIVREELALTPGMAVLERFYDPAQDVEVKVEAGIVKDYPKLNEFVSYELKVERFKTSSDGMMIIQKATIEELEHE